MSGLRLILFLTILFPWCLQAADGEAYSFYLENDARAIGGPGSDQAYSAGFKFSYLYAPEVTPGWAESFLRQSRFLSDLAENTASNFGWSLGQQIYTPNDTQTQSLIQDDRPYAAWTYLAFMAHFKAAHRADYWELNLGIVGPEAMGERVQNQYHDLIGVDKVRGWENQLKTEPTLQLSYQQRQKWIEGLSGGRRFFDVIPFYGASAGNVLLAGHAGALVRWGHNLPGDLGATRPSPTSGDFFLRPEMGSQSERSERYFLFAGGRVIVVGRSLFLEGNNFQSSHRVTRYPIVGETEFGVGAQWKNWQFGWRYVTRSPEFEEKSRFNSFASLNLAFSH